MFVPFKIEIEKCYDSEHEFGNSQLETWLETESACELFNHNSQIATYFEDQQTDRVFIDPVADYMESFFSFNL